MVSVIVYSRVWRSQFWKSLTLNQEDIYMHKTSGLRSLWAVWGYQAWSRNLFISTVQNKDCLNLEACIGSSIFVRNCFRGFSIRRLFVLIAELVLCCGYTPVSDQSEGLCLTVLTLMYQAVADCIVIVVPDPVIVSICFWSSFLLEAESFSWNLSYNAIYAESKILILILTSTTIFNSPIEWLNWCHPRLANLRLCF